jgi:hypothetical protein
MTDNAIPLEEFVGPRKPCPFCGSTNLEMNCWEEYLVCKKCDASAPFGQWQFRAHETELATAKAREREAVDKLERWAEWDREHPMGEVGLENPDAMAEHLATLTPEDLAPITELFERKKRERERVAGLESALASARKALEEEEEEERNRSATVIVETFTWGDGQAITEEEARAALESINGGGHAQ